MLFSNWSSLCGVDGIVLRVLMPHRPVLFLAVSYQCVGQCATSQYLVGLDVWLGAETTERLWTCAQTIVHYSVFGFSCVYARLLWLKSAFNGSVIICRASFESAHTHERQYGVQM